MEFGALNFLFNALWSEERVLSILKDDWAQLMQDKVKFSNEIKKITAKIAGFAKKKDLDLYIKSLPEELKHALFLWVASEMTAKKKVKKENTDLLSFCFH